MNFFYGIVGTVMTEKGKKEYLTIRKDKVIMKCTSENEAKALSKASCFRSAYDINYDMVTTPPSKS